MVLVVVMRCLVYSRMAWFWLWLWDVWCRRCQDSEVGEAWGHTMAGRPEAPGLLSLTSLGRHVSWRAVMEKWVSAAQQSTSPVLHRARVSPASVTSTITILQPYLVLGTDWQTWSLFVVGFLWNFNLISFSFNEKSGRTVYDTCKSCLELMKSFLKFN